MSTLSKFPWLVCLDGRAVPGMPRGRTAELYRVAKAIETRTRSRAFFNQRTGGIYFSRQDTASVGLREVPFEVPGQPPMRYTARDIEDIVLSINAQRMSESEKDRRMASIEKSAKHDQDEKFDRGFEDRIRGMENLLRFCRSKRGMHRGYRRSAIVPGLADGRRR